MKTSILILTLFLSLNSLGGNEGLNGSGPSEKLLVKLYSSFSQKLEKCLVSDFYCPSKKGVLELKQHIEKVTQAQSKLESPFIFLKDADFDYYPADSNSKKTIYTQASLETPFFVNITKLYVNISNYNIPITTDKAVSLLIDGFLMKDGLSIETQDLENIINALANMEDTVSSEVRFNRYEPLDILISSYKRNQIIRSDLEILIYNKPSYKLFHPIQAALQNAFSCYNSSTSLFFINPYWNKFFKDTYNVITDVRLKCQSMTTYKSFKMVISFDLLKVQTRLEFKDDPIVRIYQ